LVIPSTEWAASPWRVMAFVSPQSGLSGFLPTAIDAALPTAMARGWGRAGHHGCFHHQSPSPLEYRRDSRSWGVPCHFRTSPRQHHHRHGAVPVGSRIPYPPSNASLSVWCGRCAATRAAAGEKPTGSERSRVGPPAPAERRNASSMSTALLKAVRGDEIEQISRAVNSPHQQNEDADRGGRSAAGPEQE